MLSVRKTIDRDGGLAEYWYEDKLVVQLRVRTCVGVTQQYCMLQGEPNLTGWMLLPADMERWATALHEQFPALKANQEKYIRLDRRLNFHIGNAEQRGLYVRGPLEGSYGYAARRAYLGAEAVVWEALLADLACWQETTSWLSRTARSNLHGAHEGGDLGEALARPRLSTPLHR